PNTAGHSGARRNQGANRRPGTSRTHISPSCRINRVSAERDIRPKVGRYRLRARHDERHPFHRVRSGRPVQDRIIAKASANASELADALTQWRKRCTYIRPEDWVFASKRYRGRRPYWGQAILRKYICPAAQRVGIQKRFGWHTFRHTYSTLLRSVGTEFKMMQT